MSPRAWYWMCFIFMAACVLPMTAHAEGGLLSQVSQILANNISPTDESMAMLRSVLGEFVLNPFSQTASNDGNVMGDMFKTFNMFIFIVAMLWFTYTAFAGLAQTMHEGVILGRRMSTVWLPIRISFGAASLMPVFGGWAFCQALMVIAATLGIAGANAVSKTAIDSSAGFKVTVNPMGSVKQAGQLHDIELHMLLSAACTRAANALNKEAVEYRGVSAVTNYAPTITSTKSSVAMKFPNDQGPTGCGKIELEFSPRSNNSMSNSIFDYSASATFGFRINGVNYEAIRSVAMQSHNQTLKAVYDSANKIVDGALSTEANSAEINNAITLLNTGYFGSYAKQFQAQLQQMTQAANGASNVSAVSDQLLNNMKEGGWATLGVWYSVFAEVNEAMNEMLDPVVHFEEPKLSTTSVDDSVVSAISGLISAAQSKAQAQENASGNAVGNVSLGQYLMGGVMSMTAGANATGASQTINPIIAFKNIGDNALALAQTLYFGIKVVENIPGASALGTLAEKAASIGAKSTGIMGIITSIAADAGSLLVPISFILFATAAAMAFYLPMLPFIQWFAALVQWFTSILESLVGSSLWALAHFDSDGEGMGQRTSYGYLYLFNNFARPIVLTFAFFFASGTVTVLGTFLFKYFGPAVASAQGSSLTGLMSIIAFLVIFTILGMSLINSSFSLLLSMADRIIGWIGQHPSSHIGADVESRVNSVFINAARSGGNVLAQKPKGAGGSGQSGSLLDSIRQQGSGGHGGKD